MILTGKVEVADEVTLVVPAPDEAIRAALRIDPDGEGRVWVGDATVTKDTGFVVDAGDSLGATFATTEALYGICDSGESATVVWIGVRQ